MTRGYLELAPCSSRCHLIRGWETLFQQLDEHLSSLASMRLSPYFRVFEVEPRYGGPPNEVRAALDVWIDVQRAWVYLEGTLCGAGAADVRVQLPAEHARFQVIDAEFLALMRSVKQQPNLLVLSLPDLQQTLGDSQLFSQGTARLSAYLERQRGASALLLRRDEDLLEVIGSSRSPAKVQRHLSKIFAGISSVKVDGDVNASEESRWRRTSPSAGAVADSPVVVAFFSREGSVPLAESRLSTSPTIPALTAGSALWRLAWYRRSHSK